MQVFILYLIKKEFPAEIENIYKINTQDHFERENKNNLIEKNIILLAKIKTKHFMRKDKVFSELEFNQPYVIHQKFLNNSFLGTTRGDWKKLKTFF